jgi:ribosomal protein S18 acetylase RimI-like enzyme
MIRLSKILEIPDILNITKACACTMSARGIFQWNEHYPDRDTFLKDLERNELFVYEDDSKIVGVVVVTELKDQEYEEIEWIAPEGRNHYIHRLAVHPDFQGRGYARKLMDFAEKMARDRDAVSVRLDTFSRNKRNQKFYEQRGYSRLGDIYFPRQSPFPFHCYELIL